jgi:hypothetical protein
MATGHSTRPRICIRCNQEFEKKKRWGRHCKVCESALKRERRQQESPERTEARIAKQRALYVHYRETGRLSHRRLLVRHKEWNRLKRAIKRGDVVRASACEACGRTTTRLCGHHEDYSKPLEVIWLCMRCHRYIHTPSTRPEILKKLGRSLLAREEPQ